MTTTPFLKWAGGKRRQVDYLASKLPPGRRLVEPFVGSGAGAPAHPRAGAHQCAHPRRTARAQCAPAPLHHPAAAGH